MDLQYLLLTFTNGSNTLSMGTGCDIKIISVKGFEAADYTNHTESNATEDGETLTGKKVGRRLLEVKFGVDTDPNETVLIRRELIRFFNPKNVTKLSANYCYSQAKIECEIDEFDFDDQDTFWSTLIGTVTLLCPYPYWESLDNFGKNIAANMPAWGWPLVFAQEKQEHHELGKIFSYREFTKIVTLDNDGDVDTGITIEFTAKTGAVKNPIITKVSTGEYIKVNVDMAMGDVLTINTNPGQKKITLNGATISKQIDKLSTYFSINVGENQVQYDADENYINLEVRLYYTRKMLGL